MIWRRLKKRERTTFVPPASKKYKWPKRKDTDIVSPDLIFCTKPRLREEGLEFCLENEGFITKQFQNYKNDLNE